MPVSRPTATACITFTPLWARSSTLLARKQKCRVIITNNYKDYRLLLGAQIIKPSKVRTIAR